MKLVHRSASLLPCLFAFCLLSGCSWMPSFSIPFFGSDSSEQNVKQSLPPKSLPAPQRRISPEVRNLIDEARRCWTDGGECLEPERATALLDKAIALDPLDPAPYLLRSRSLCDLGYMSEAFDDATKAIRLSPTAEAYATRGFICLRQNQMQGAKRDFEYAEKLDASEPLIYIYRAAGYFLEDRKTDACDDLERACELGRCLPWEQAQKNKVCR